MTTVGAALMLTLLAAAPSAAAHAVHAGRAPAVSRGKAFAADLHAPSPKKLARQIRAIGGPLAKTSGSVRGSVAVRKSSIRHTHRRAPHREDDNAIQNDAPAAHVEVAFSLDLEPLGLYFDASEQQPLTRFFSPRAPRGPPATA